MTNRRHFHDITHHIPKGAAVADGLSRGVPAMGRLQEALSGKKKYPDQTIHRNGRRLHFGTGPTASDSRRVCTVSMTA